MSLTFNGSTMSRQPKVLAWLHTEPCFAVPSVPGGAHKTWPHRIKLQERISVGNIRKNFRTVRAIWLPRKVKNLLPWRWPQVPLPALQISGAGNGGLGPVSLIWSMLQAFSTFKGIGEVTWMPLNQSWKGHQTTPQRAEMFFWHEEAFARGEERGRQVLPSPPAFQHWYSRPCFVLGWDESWSNRIMYYLLMFEDNLS